MGYPSVQQYIAFLTMEDVARTIKSLCCHGDQFRCFYTLEVLDRFEVIKYRFQFRKKSLVSLCNMNVKQEALPLLVICLFRQQYPEYLFLKSQTFKGLTTLISEKGIMMKSMQRDLRLRSAREDSSSCGCTAE